MAPDYHQLTLSNAFQRGWKVIGGWYMGSLFVRLDQKLTRKQLQYILADAKGALGTDIEGDSVEEMVAAVEERMRNLLIYIEKASPVPLTNLAWKWSVDNPRCEWFAALLEGNAEATTYS